MTFKNVLRVDLKVGYDIPTTYYLHGYVVLNLI